MEEDTMIEVRINTQLLKNINDVDKDISKVVSTALNIWLAEKRKLLNCPVTKNLCINTTVSCNDCSVVEDS